MLRPRRWAAEQEYVAKGRGSTVLADALNQLYPDYEHPGHFPNLPCGVIWRPVGVRDPDAVLGQLTPREPHVNEDLLNHGRKFVQFLKDSGKPVENYWKGYCASTLSVDERTTPFKLDCQIYNYEKALATCDILEWEALAKAGCDPRNAESLIKELKLRHLVHSLTDDPVKKPIGRQAALAISALVMVRTEVEQGVIISLRSRKGVAVHSNLYHVAPSGMFSIETDETAKEFSVRHAVFREYLEELFGLRSGAPMRYDHFYENRNLLYLKELLKKGDAIFLITGLVVNLLNLRPEICVMLYIDNPEWFANHLGGREGLTRLSLSEEFEPNRCSFVPLSRLFQAEWLKVENLVPPGAAALFLGLDAAKKQGWMQLCQSRTANSM
jgi:hypothetical protein